MQIYLNNLLVLLHQKVGHHLRVPVDEWPGSSSSSYHQTRVLTCLRGEAGVVPHVLQLLLHDPWHQVGHSSNVKDPGVATQSRAGQSPGRLGEVRTLHNTH